MGLNLKPEGGRNARLSIYAALIALGVKKKRTQHDYERAWKIAEEVRVVALNWLKQRRNVDDLFRGVGSVPAGLDVPTGVLPEAPGDPLIEVLDAYDKGVALVALNEYYEEGSTLLEQAQLYLQRAKRALELLPRSVREKDVWRYWHQEVLKQLATLEDELE